MSYTIEALTEATDVCGEAPTWDPRSGQVLWVDNESSLVFSIPAAGGQRSILSKGIAVGAIAINRAGGFVFAGHDGVVVWRSPTDATTLLTEYQGQKLLFNDMIADAQGRLYAGTMYWGPKGMERTGGLYLIQPTGRIEPVDENIELSNGLGFSPDNRTLYFADSTARRIYAYDVQSASGALTGKRVLVACPVEDGIPDGLTVDCDGFIWCAFWYGAQIIRYDPQGKIERRIAMPVRQVSSVGFGGNDLTDLYVTTAANSWQGPYAPPGYDFKASNIGGSLYRVRTDIQGKPEHWAAF